MGINRVLLNYQAMGMAWFPWMRFLPLETSLEKKWINNGENSPRGEFSPCFHPFFETRMFPWRFRFCIILGKLKWTPDFRSNSEDGPWMTTDRSVVFDFVPKTSGTGSQPPWFIHIFRTGSPAKRAIIFLVYRLFITFGQPIGSHWIFFFYGGYNIYIYIYIYIYIHTYIHTYIYIYISTG